MDDLRGTLTLLGTLEEITGDSNAITSTSVGSEHYISILSFVKDNICWNQAARSYLSTGYMPSLGCSCLTGILWSVMKVEKCPQETYADIGGLVNQIQEIQETGASSMHPEY